MLPEVALIVVLPCLRAVARPTDVMVATLVVDEVQVTELVRFWLLPSEYLPVAVYCTLVAIFTVWLAGVTVIDTRAAGPTVKVVLPVTPAELALIWEVPCAAPVARPPEVIVAILVLDDVQVTELVRFWVDPSEYVPAAVNCCVLPLGIEGFAGVTAIDTRVAGPTARVVLPVTPSELALISDVLCAIPVARPPDVTVATLVFDEAQLTTLVRFWMDPSE